MRLCPARADDDGRAGERQGLDLRHSTAEIDVGGIKLGPRAEAEYHAHGSLARTLYKGEITRACTILPTWIDPRSTGLCGMVPPVIFDAWRIADSKKR
jgi:hypothetical protein